MDRKASDYHNGEHWVHRVVETLADRKVQTDYAGCKELSCTTLLSSGDVYRNYPGTYTPMEHIGTDRRNR